MQSDWFVEASSGNVEESMTSLLTKSDQIVDFRLPQEEPCRHWPQDGANTIQIVITFTILY